MVMMKKEKIMTEGRRFFLIISPCFLELNLAPRRDLNPQPLDLEARVLPKVSRIRLGTQAYFGKKLKLRVFIWS